jgi:cytochrome c oxidase subunit I+III
MSAAPALPPSAPSASELEHLRRELLDTWHQPTGPIGWLMNTDHKVIGLRYIVTTFVNFALAGILAAIMRLQLSRPDNTLVGPDFYNQLFTMHGTAMMFLFAVPIMGGFGTYLVPLMVGTREVPFPRLNAYGYQVFVVGSLLLWIAFLLNVGPDVGWFAYTPLSGPEYGTGKRVDVWAQMITFTEISALVVAVNLATTILKMRAPGMSLNRIPLFCWAMLVQSFMVIFAMPSVMLDSGMLAMDRLVGTHFFNPAEGGDPLLWQHLFWFFAHPEVYIIFIPALGFISSIMAPFARRPVFGYTAMVLSMVSTAFIGFGVWVHHMFATGLPQMGESFFTAASMLISIPTGVQIFCWLATLWSGRLHLKTPLLFVLGFFAVFVIGGLTGVMLAAVPFNLQAHDTFFVVAHLHYVLIGGSVFPLFGAFYYWFPKWTGRLLGERLGQLNFWLMFVGFNLTFFPLHILGMRGMPRRVYTYPAEMGWDRLNMLASVGAMILAVGILVFVVNVASSLKRGALSGPDPWRADTLEWAAASPPLPFNFEHIPVVRSREPLWTRTEGDPIVVGMRSDQREILVTQPVDAEPDHREVLPEPGIAPFLVTLATAETFVLGIFTPRAYVVGAVMAFVGLFVWLWPKGDPHDDVKAAIEDAPPGGVA